MRDLLIQIGDYYYYLIQIVFCESVNERGNEECTTIVNLMLKETEIFGICFRNTISISQLIRRNHVSQPIDPNRHKDLQLNLFFE